MKSYTNYINTHIKQKSHRANATLTTSSALGQGPGGQGSQTCVPAPPGSQAHTFPQKQCCASQPEQCPHQATC